MSNLEIAANVMIGLATLLAGRNSVHNWWTGIIGCALFALLFYQTKLYADVVLQVFFVLTCMLGWWQWLRGDHGKPKTVGKAGIRTLAWIVPLGIVATFGYGTMLHTYTNAYSPFVDSAVLVFSVIAQLLMMQRKVESWAFWLLANTIAVPLYASRGLHLTAVLNAAYWVNAIISWRLWIKLAKV